MECPTCSSLDIELIESSGHAVCIQCGTVLEENTIVSSVEFQETGDRSHVIGQFVSATSSKAYGSGSRGNSRYGFSRESREATLANARRNIAQVASSLRLPSYFIDRAQRLYSLALQRNFVYGRRQMHIVATVLYTICRQEKSPHLLIDFSDILQVNVYTLGKSFLQLTKLLNLNLMIVDPSLYIHRFATRLELGDKVNAVTTTALRIVSRMKKDWINTGRRPDGVCAAAMLLACRSYEIIKDINELANIFRVSVVTIKKRLLEFRNTPAAQLTLLQFHQHDFRSELDPPIYMKQQHISATQKGLRVTFDLSEPNLPTDLSTQLTTQESLQSDTTGLNLEFQSQGYIDNTGEVLYNQKGQLVQRVVLDGVDVLVPLPTDTGNSLVTSDHLQELSNSKRKRKASSQRKLDKYHRRKVLYGTMYAEMTEAIDASVEGDDNGNNDDDNDNDNDESDNNDGDNDNDINNEANNDNLNDNLDDEIRSTIKNKIKSKVKGKVLKNTERFPQLIAQISTDPISQTLVTTQSEGSVTGSVSGKYKQLADALYLEAQEVERKNDELISVWGGNNSLPNSISISSSSSSINNNNLSQIGSTHGAYVILRGDGKDETKFNDESIEDSVDLDSNLDSLFLTQEEQQKKTAIWEKMHRQFLDERLRKRIAKERGEGGMKTVGTNLNKSKMKKELNIAIDPSKILASTSWESLQQNPNIFNSSLISSTATSTTSTIPSSSTSASTSSTVLVSGSGTGSSSISGTKKIRIGASFSNNSNNTFNNETNSNNNNSNNSNNNNNKIGSLVENILEEEKGKNKDKNNGENEDNEDIDEDEDDEGEGEGEEALVYDYGGGMDDYDDDGDDEYY